VPNRDDWRLQGQENYLKGVTLVHQLYRKYKGNAHWDHDHCAFCLAKFMIEDFPDVLHRGYSTEDDYHWICESCYQDFVGMFDWKTVEKLP
jgi:hypothetical protein